MKKKFFITLLLFCVVKIVTAQRFKPEDTEFKDTGRVLIQLKLRSGINTNFNSTPDVSVGGIQLSGYVTPKFLVHVARVGLVADAFYTAKHLEAAFGPSICFKIA